ncbi:MAG: phage tail sheath subtilisin-like domain-containing protein, partial [Primorskyibacter sp.]
MPQQFLHGVEVIQVDDGIRPIRIVKSSVIGIVGTAPDAVAADFPLNTPILIEGPRKAAGLGNAGTLKDAYEAIYAQGASVAVMIRVEEGVDAATTLANVVGTATQGSGLWGLMNAQSVLDLTPRILCAPGFTSTTPGDPASPVITNLISVAERIRAVVIADGPNTSETDARSERGNWGSDRLFLVDPAVRVFDTNTATYVTRPASAYVAGLIAKRDIEKGFWWSPSNQVIRG